jgi:hypothetical protein
MAFMKFYVGTEASVQEHLDGIYLATDTRKIFYNGSAYGGGDVDLNNYLTKDYLKSYSIPIDGSGTGISKQILFNYSQQTTHNGMFYLLSRYTSYASDHTGLLVRNRTGGNSTYGYAAGGVYLTAGGVYSGGKSRYVNPSIRVGELLCTTSSGSDAVDEAGYPRDWGTHSVLSKKDLIFYSDDATNVKLASFNTGGITIKDKTSSDLLHAAGGTISIDELKSKLNIPDISVLQGAIGTNTYTGANYISKETNLTEAVLQLDEEIKATNDNLALEHTNAEATYAKKSELDDYLPLAGGKMATSPYSDDYIRITPKGTGSAATPYIYISGQATTNEDDKFYIGIGRRFPGQSSSAGARIWAETNFSQMIIDPKSGSITAFRKGTVEGVKETQYRYNGVYMVGKTPNDLLHANGGTVSIQDIISQVTIPKATTSTLGGIKVGDGLEITEDGTLNCIIDPGSGSVSWGNITGKPSVFSTNIASINDLNASWDSVLKAAPSGYVTRWPSISEVTGKQNLVIKLNGGATEGTNMFTFNGSTAKSLNITASGIGAAASSHTHTKNQITDFPTTWAWSSIAGKPTFATVATSGSYNDLTNKPTIPSLTGYATQSWVNSQGFAKGSFLPLTGGTLSGDLIRSNSGDVKRAKINNLEISVYDSINTTCKAIMSCTSNYGVVEVGNNLNNKNVHIDANTGITLKGTGVGISLSTGGSSSKFFATDGSVQTINVDNFALKSTTDALTAITENQDKKISNMKLGMARYTSGTTAQVITGDEGTVGLSGTPALYFYNGGISGGTVPVKNCIRVKDAQCYVDSNGIYFAFPIVSTESNGIMASKDKQYLNWVVNSQFGTTIGMDEPNLLDLAKVSSAANYVKTHLSTFITNNTSADLDVIQVLQGFIVGDNVHLKLAISIKDTESQVYTVKPQNNNNIVATAISSNNDYRAIVDLWFIVNNLSFAMDRKYVLDY